MAIDYKFRNFDEARRTPADMAMALLDHGEIRLYANKLGTITAELRGRKKGQVIRTDHSTITEALAALDATFHKRGDYAD